MPNSTSTSADFSVDGGRSSAWAYCISAPTSPNHLKEFYGEFDHLPADDQTDEFAFHVTKDDAKNPTVSAAELFHAGKIRPLCGGDCGGAEEVETSTSVRSPLLSSSTSPTSSNPKEDWSNVSKKFWRAFTPKRNKPTNAHANRHPALLDDEDDDDSNYRGRGRLPCLSSSASRRRGTRSLSPIRLTNYPVWEVNVYDGQKKKNRDSNATELTPSKSSRMRKLKNFLLFRSASEGHAPHKSESSKKLGDEVSPWKRHYAIKKAESDDLKKKTFLPYKKGILGR